MLAIRRFYHGVLIGCSACGLYAGGPSGTRPDASADAAVEPCTTPPGDCLAALPPGWTPLVRVGPGEMCPETYTQHDIVSDPVALTGACKCACAIDAQPSCSKGQFTIKYTPSCNFDWNLQANDGQCGTTNFVILDKNNAIAPPTLTPGTCTAGVAMPDLGKTTHSTARVCTVPAECNEDACRGRLAGVACIEHLGAAACPPGDFSMPFGIYGDGVSVACTPCTACSVAAQCGPATLRFYDDMGCTNQTEAVPMNGTCTGTNASGQATHYKYDAPVTNVACNAMGTTATADVSSKRTICCRSP
jgi:hypothetical protein